MIAKYFLKILNTCSFKTIDNPAPQSTMTLRWAFLLAKPFHNCPVQYTICGGGGEGAGDRSSSSVRAIWPELYPAILPPFRYRHCVYMIIRQAKGSLCYMDCSFLASRIVPMLKDCFWSSDHFLSIFERRQVSNTYTVCPWNKAKLYIEPLLT